MRGGMKNNYFTRLLTPFIVIVLSLVLVFPLVAGCGGGGANTFLELMSLVPADFIEDDSNNPVFFILIDYASTYRDDGITFSTFDELFSKLDKDKISYYILGWGSYITGYGSHADTSTIRKEYVGYDITCVDAEIQFGQPPANGVAAIGRFDPQATEDAFSQQDMWPSWAVDAYTAEDYHGVTIHSWGNGLEAHLAARFMPPHVDELGRARPLAVTDKHLFYAASVETVKLMIDASQNQYSSLADLPEYAAIANGLAGLNTYTAMVCDATVANRCLDKLENGDTQLSETEREILINSLGTPLKKFLTFGSGFGQDENGNYMTIVIYHQSSDDALANVSLLKQRIESVKSSLADMLWSELVTETDIRTEGNVVLAKLYTSAGFWASWIYAGDNLLFHEE